MASTKAPRHKFFLEFQMDYFLLLLFLVPNTTHARAQVSGTSGNSVDTCGSQTTRQEKGFATARDATIFIKFLVPFVVDLFGWWIRRLLARCRRLLLGTQQATVKTKHTHTHNLYCS